MTRIDGLGIRPLVVAPIPFLCATFHLCHVIGSQGQALETTTSSHGTGGNEVVKGETIKGTKCTPQTFDSLEDRLGRRISPARIVVGDSRILDIVATLESLEGLGAGIVDILGIGDKLRRRRSVGSRHFEWRTG